MIRSYSGALAVIGLVLLIGLAGCASNGGGNATQAQDKISKQNQTGQEAGQMDQNKTEMKPKEGKTSDETDRMEVWKKLDPEIKKIVRKTAKATGEVKSYRYRFQQRMKQNINQVLSNGTSVNGSMTLVQNGSGAINLESKRSKSTVVQNVTSLEFGGNGTPLSNGPKGRSGLNKSTVEAYLVNNTIYMKNTLGGGNVTSAMAGSGNWTKFSLPRMFSKMWKQKQRLDATTQFITASSNVKLLPDQKLNGVDTYVLESTPDPEKFQERVNNELAGMGMSGLQKLTNMKFNDVKTTMWISKESYLPLKTDTEMTITSSMRLPSTGERKQATVKKMEQKMEMNTTNTFRDYNSDIQIELPEKVRNAESMSSMMQRKGKTRGEGESMPSR
ncbi:MAG: DUF6612 family protein [Halobacteria archaeon]